MFALRHWNSWREMERLSREMERILHGEQSRGDANWPQLNLWMNADELLVVMQAPGLDTDKLEIHVVQNQLTISGSFIQPALTETERFQRRERLLRPFERTLQLPFAVDSQQAEAVYRAGILEIRLRRPEEEKPRQLKVQAG